MSTLTKLQVRNFLISKKGYLKKSALQVAKAMWKSSEAQQPKNKVELEKELQFIKNVQTALRAAQAVVEEDEDTSLVDLYNTIQKEKDRPKRRLFFDIEVSANLVFSWGLGNKVCITPDHLVQERAIICICWKWEGETEVKSMEWDNGDDKAILTKFTKIIDSADEVIGQNSDSFDIKWLRTRCIYHGLPISRKFNSIDTLKMARHGFRFNSNKLDYMGQFLGLGKKMKTDYSLWKDIMLKNDKKAMNTMVDYCKQDVRLLEQVYDKLKEYVPAKKFKYKK